MVNLSTELYNLFDMGGSHIATFLEWLARTYVLPPDVAILDVGCGTGRLFDPLAGLGWQITGLEPDPHYCESAQALASGYDNVRVRCGGFMDIREEATYDLVVAVNAPFAYLRTMPDRLQALHNIYRSLKPEGVVFLDFPNFLHVLKSYREPKPSVTKSSTGETVRRVIQHEIDLHDGTFTHTDFFYIDNQLASKQVHPMSIITPTETFYLLETAGFGEIMSFNSYGARSSQRLNSGRLMVSARKMVGR